MNKAIDDFKSFLKAYCNKHRIKKEEAMRHALIKETEKYYDKRDEDCIWPGKII